MQNQLRVAPHVPRSQVEKDFSFSLFELDWDVFSFNIEGAINRVPAIENTGVKSTVCGPGQHFIPTCYI